MQFDRVILDITSRCNLKCSVCYSADIQQQDLPWETLEELAKSMRHKVVSLSGGEPTLRDDLPRIIRLFNKRNTVFLITNGIRLADPAYTRQLRDAGLGYISFSFNAFSAQAGRTIYGQDLREVKLKALDNIRQNKIKTILSVLIAPGVNEDELKPIFDYCTANTDFIRELRIRSMLSFGRHLEGEKYSLDQLRQLICRKLGIKAEEIAAEEKLQEKLTRMFRLEKSLKPCSSAFHVRIRPQGIIPVGRNLLEKEAGMRTAKPGGLFFTLLDSYGPAMLLAGLLKTLARRDIPWIHEPSVLKLAIRSWPLETDSDSFAGCRTGYYSQGKIVPFCYAHNQNAKQPLKNDN